MTRQPASKKDITDAWDRYADDNYNLDDLNLIRESIGKGGSPEGFDEAFDRVRREAAGCAPSPTPEQRETYKTEAARLIARYESARGAEKHTPAPKRRPLFRRMWYAAAAIVLAAVSIPAALRYFDSEPPQYVETATAAGETKVVLLSDDTRVTLNAESRLRYPDGFSGGERAVELEGEALFEVASDPGRPFLVKTENMQVQVLGTVFDVKEYGNDATSSVSVSSGKVEVDLDGSHVQLGMNQRVEIDRATGNFVKSSADAEKFFSWKEGALYFNKTPIEEVVNVLNRHYPQTRIELAEGNYTNLISGEHDNQSMEVRVLGAP